MKKMIKMSLAAALAVAGLSTTASAGGLEEAIKGVTIGGKFEVEYDYVKDESAANETTDGWDYDWDLTAKVPVNDQVTAVFTAQADSATNIDGGAATTASNDDSDINLAKMYFVYSNAGATVMVGKQGKAGAPWFDDERANGVVGLYTTNGVTVAAANFTGSNAPLLAGTDISAAAIIGKVGPVNASLWYADISNVATSYSINAKGSIDMVSLDVTYTDADYENTNNDADLLKIVAAASLDAATVYAGYGTTSDTNGASLNGVDLTGDSDASVNFGTEQLFIDDLSDADAFLIGATMTNGAWKFDLSYVDGDHTNGTVDFDETLLDVEYKMSKNLTIDAFYSSAELGNVDMDAASIALEYKF